jgi:hypothetical protein
MTLDKMTLDKMTLDKMTLDKMTLDKMTLDKMTLKPYQEPYSKHYIFFLAKCLCMIFHNLTLVLVIVSVFKTK